MRKSLRLFITGTILMSFSLTIYAFDRFENIKQIEPKPVTIRGKLQDYHSEFKTGMITYFDVITRTPETEVFAFDSVGNFEVSFRLTHEVYGCVNLKYAKNMFDIFVEPSKTYNVKISNNTLNFTDSENSIGNELIKFETALNNDLWAEIQSANSAHNSNLSIIDYIAIQKDIEVKKLSFLNTYKSNYKLSDDALKILKNKIKYKTANSWINYRFDYSGKTPILRDSLPKDFYTMLFKEYPINSKDGYIVREYIDYLSNIGTTMDNSKVVTSDERIEFYKKLDFFSENELQLLAKVYSGDIIALASNELKEFNNDNMKKMLEFEARKRFQMNKIYINSLRLPEGFGRDLILSQKISFLYFSNSYSPMENEWKAYENIFTNKPILNYLKIISSNEPKTKIEKEQKAPKTEIDDYTQKVIDKYFKNHLGKVIYVDFWATWCSPCKKEIPFAKELHIELEKNKNIVFINFCVKSDQNAWNKIINEQQISGINYFLNDDECNILTKYFQVNGYPTYILIDKNGKTVEYSAPRPSSKQEIMNMINKLIQ